MSCILQSRTVIAHRHAQRRFVPSVGEIIIVRLSLDLCGPGSATISQTLPSHANRHNYHHAVVLEATATVTELRFMVFPMPSYSSLDPASGLSSTSWLLHQSNELQQFHIPVPYEEDPSLVPPHPIFRTPALFGNPLEIGGWKDRRPSWVVVSPDYPVLKHTTMFKSFDPPVVLSLEEVQRLQEYSVSSDTISSHPPVSPDLPPMGDTTIPHQPEGNHNGVGQSVGTSTSSGLQDLYKHAFADSDRSVTLTSDSEDDDDDDWDDKMDPITFARHYAANHLLFAKIVQEHDQKIHERLNQGILSWMEDIQSEMS